jgi:DNA-binding transcriptional MocR family regulator
MAARFTTAELAALKIIADEIRSKGTCGLVLDAIAARAGVSKRSVQNALREAEALGYLTIRRRRLPGQLKNLPNLVSIIAPEWLAWLKMAKPSTPRVKPKIPSLGTRTWPSKPIQSSSHGRITTFLKVSSAPS